MEAQTSPHRECGCVASFQGAHYGPERPFTINRIGFSYSAKSARRAPTEATQSGSTKTLLLIGFGFEASPQPEHAERVMV